MKSKLARKTNIIIIDIVYLLLFTVICSYYFIAKKEYTYLVLLLLLIFMMILINIIFIIIYRKERLKDIKTLSFYLRDNDINMGTGSIENFSLPLVFLSKAGDTIWYNDLFKSIFDDKQILKKTLSELYTVHIKDKIEVLAESLDFTCSIGNRIFYAYTNVINQKNKVDNTYYIMIYMVENTALEKLKTQFEDKQVAVGEIVIDSFEEIYQQSGEAVANEVSVELAKIFTKWIIGKNALIRKLVRDRYILVVENKSLKEMEKDKFSVLSQAKMISVGNRIPVTISIGISAHAENITNSNIIASKALELALGRGGDQAIVRIGNKDTYYGGSNFELESTTKVKSRVVASMLKEEILKSSRLIIMGHTSPDMDSLGSSLAVYRAATLMGVTAKIVLHSSNQSIDTMLKNIDTIPEYKGVIIEISEALNLIDDTALVVVVDTFRRDNTDEPSLLDYAARIAIFDHHRRGYDFIRDNVVLDYSETYASSTSELLIEVLMYMKKNLTIPKIEAEALYAGMIVDTKNFTFKTGTRTFEVASFLRGQGVDTIAVRQYYQPDIEAFKQVAAITTSASIYFGNISIARCPSSIKNNRLVSSMAADQMLNIAGIDASFVLSEAGPSVSISGRSLGDINVQVICEKMGGGGHLIAAGCLLKEVSIDYAEKELLKRIDEYLNN